MSAPSPLTSDSDLVSFTVDADDVDLGQGYEIISVVVERALNRIPTARIVVRDGSAANESFAVSAGTDFAPGVSLTISAGYHEKNKPIFTGVVVKSAIQQRRNGGSCLTVHLRDTAAAMTIGRRSACYTETTDSEVMQTLISNHHLTADVASTSAQLEELTQFAATDWDFLLARAETNGLVVLVTDGKVSVKAPALSGSAVLGVTYGIDILEVELEEDARTQLASVACTAWDPATQKIVTSTESTTDQNPLGADTSSKLAQVAGAPAFQLQTPTPLPAATLKAWAEAQLLKFSLAKIRGTVRFQGSAALAPDNLLEIAGLGERFDGKAYVSGVTHELHDGEWTTEATIGLDPDWFVTRPDIGSPPAAALLPAAHGLHIGTVKQIDQDPTGEFRVLVAVPVVDNTGKGIWARLARPYATKNAGSFFYPETDDEVVLAFLDSDPRFPVIVGSLFSSARPPPLTPDQKNTQKAIITNSQLKLLFDEEKKIITLITPGGNKVVISDDQKSITLADQNQNTAELSPSGITLTSASNMLLKAQQNITLQAETGKIAATAAQDVTVSGLNVSLTAQAQFSASASATASLSGSVETKIQGAMVMIN